VSPFVDLQGPFLFDSSIGYSSERWSDALLTRHDVLQRGHQRPKIVILERRNVRYQWREILSLRLPTNVLI
jgi:hypothetical protein